MGLLFITHLFIFDVTRVIMGYIHHNIEHRCSTRMVRIDSKLDFLVVHMFLSYPDHWFCNYSVSGL